MSVRRRAADQPRIDAGGTILAVCIMGAALVAAGITYAAAAKALLVVAVVGILGRLLIEARQDVRRGA